MTEIRVTQAFELECNLTCECKGVSHTRQKKKKKKWEEEQIGARRRIIAWVIQIPGGGFSKTRNIAT